MAITYYDGLDHSQCWKVLSDSTYEYSYPVLTWDHTEFQLGMRIPYFVILLDNVPEHIRRREIYGSTPLFHRKSRTSSANSWSEELWEIKRLMAVYSELTDIDLSHFDARSLLLQLMAEP